MPFEIDTSVSIVCTVPSGSRRYSAPAPRALVEGHGARPEAAGRVAGSVVHAVLGTRRFHRGQQGVRPDFQSRRANPPATASTSPPSAAPRERAHRPAHVHAAAGARFRTEGMDAPAHDVDPEQALPARVPARSLPKVRPRVQHQLDGGNGHERRLPSVFAPPKPRRSQPSSNSWMRPPVRGCARRPRDRA